MKSNNPRNQTNDSNDKPQRVSVSGKVSVEYDSTEINNVANAIRNESTRNQGAAQQIEEAENRQADEQSRGNTIAIWATIISAAMFFATLLVFFQSKDAIKAANKSADVAEKTFKEVKKEFEFENRPFIFMAYFKIDSLKARTKYTYTIYVKNFGKIPTYIETIKAGMMFSTNDTLDKDSFQYEPENIRPTYYFLPISDTLRWPGYGKYITDDMLNMITHLKLFPFVYGEFNFVDLATKRRGSYIYCFRVFWDGRFIPTKNHNDIIEENDSSLIQKQVSP
jgi:hypothetical protein